MRYSLRWVHHRSGNGWTDVVCSAHKQHPSITSATDIDKVTNTAISKGDGAASRCMGQFSHSSTTCGELDKRQLQTKPNKKPVKLVL